MPSSEQITEFIGASFRSAWALELLGHLMQNPGHSHSHQDMVSELRGSDLIVRQSVESLSASGLLLVEEDGSARYAPANDELRQLAEGAVRLYATSPDAVRRLIVSSANPSVTAFAQAFRLRRD